ncbi:MAG TPA: AAA family ATPase [Lichenihabitans sp.]|jgi:predicted ATPase|nr:AAA family ATPase [Lichenihabitans sp.]
MTLRSEPARPRLERISLKGFKTIRDLSGFEPGDLTLLIGPNGAGKSNFISFFRMLSWSLVPPGQLQLFVAEQGGAGALLFKGPRVSREIEAELVLTTGKGRNVYDFRLVAAAGDTLVFAEENFRFRAHGIKDRPAPGTGAGHRESQLIRMAEDGNATARRILSMLRRIIVHQFHDTSATARIRGKWSRQDNRYLKEDGANLAPFLLRLQTRAPGHYRRIVETIRLILPHFATFELDPDDDYLLLRWLESANDQVFSAAQASDGMLRAMALVALLQQPDEDLPDVLILDEPELGLHPYAIEVLASLIRSASRRVQVIVATQSVSLIDRFEPHDVVVVSRSDDGTTLARLDDATLEEWLQSYTLSELWEKNILGGRP